MPARILVAEDFADAREMLVEYLGFLGYEVAEAADGREAVERAISFRPDVVLMDIAMPELDGREATARIKADPRTKNSVVIAITGHAVRGEDPGTVCPGCDLLLVKPVLPETIEKTLRTVLSGDGDA